MLGTGFSGFDCSPYFFHPFIHSLIQSHHLFICSCITLLLRVHCSRPCARHREDTSLLRPSYGGYLTRPALPISVFRSWHHSLEPESRLNLCLKHQAGKICPGRLHKCLCSWPGPVDTQLAEDEKDESLLISYELSTRFQPEAAWVISGR